MKKNSKHIGQLPLDAVEQSLEDVVVSTDRHPGMPALGELKAEVKKYGLLDSDAEHMFDIWMMNGFTLRTGKKVKAWKSAIRVWHRNEYFPSQKQAAHAGPTLKKPGWNPPTLEQIKAYASQKRWSPGFARHCYNTWVANNWRHYGEPIRSDEQWKAIMASMEYRP